MQLNVLNDLAKAKALDGKKSGCIAGLQKGMVVNDSGLLPKMYLMRSRQR